MFTCVNLSGVYGEGSVRRARAIKHSAISRESAAAFETTSSTSSVLQVFFPLLPFNSDNTSRAAAQISVKVSKLPPVSNLKLSLVLHF